jgi:hypothetical protein
MQWEIYDSCQSEQPLSGPRMRCRSWPLHCSVRNWSPPNWSSWDDDSFKSLEASGPQVRKVDLYFEFYSQLLNLDREAGCRYCIFSLYFSLLQYKRRECLKLGHNRFLSCIWQDKEDNGVKTHLQHRYVIIASLSLWSINLHPSILRMSPRHSCSRHWTSASFFWLISH